MEVQISRQTNSVLMRAVLFIYLNIIILLLLLLFVLQRSCVLVFSFYVIINRRSSVPILKNASTEDAWKCPDVFLISRMRWVQTWENRAVKSPKMLRAAGVQKPVSFKLALANTWRLLKVNIYRFVLLNFNKVLRPGEVFFLFLLAY